MTKIDIFSGFLGAGKTTLIKKLIKEGYKGEKLVLIENEFGDIGIDGAFLQDADIEITEMNSGCICCSLVGDFGEALKKVIKEYSPDRIIIEPSGVGKLSDVIKAASCVVSDDVKINGLSAVVDANRCKMYMKNFGEFFNDQIKNSGTVILSHTSGVSPDKISICADMIKEQNNHAVIITTCWEDLSGTTILDAIENNKTLEKELHELKHQETCPVCGHHSHESSHDEAHHDGCCHHDHEHHDCSCNEHNHHHEHDHECSCGCHEHHHHADDVFSSWGKETALKYTHDRIESILSELDDSSVYGTVLRAKGVVQCIDGTWIHFDYVPGHADVRSGSASITGRVCVIGSGIKEDKLEELFGV